MKNSRKTADSTKPKRADPIMGKKTNSMTTDPSLLTSAPKERAVEQIKVDKLQFDLRNPRYGAAAKNIQTEIEALDHIVAQFGVDDVLSSIAVNGFFDSEPLVGLRMNPSEKIKIVEGNRRLAATLILLKDSRAKNQDKIRERTLLRTQGNAHELSNTLPVIVYEGAEGQRAVLPYIGVRHIVGFLEWDSYAKADWVDRVIRENSLPLSEIINMLGDKNGTIKRMLAGYRFVNQAVAIGQFRSDQSQRKGRGSNPDYPFSWIYTALDNKPIKDFVGLLESSDGTPELLPIPEGKYEEAGWLLKFLFGDRINGVAAVVDDSREIGELAKLIVIPRYYNRLKEGAKVSVVVKEARPRSQRLQEGFYTIENELRELSGLVTPGELVAAEAISLVDSARNIVNLARKIHQDLKSIALGEEEDV